MSQQKLTEISSDTLQRHKKVHNKDNQPNPARVLKACNRCRIQKSRCDGQLPCSICQKRGVVCSFDRASPRSKRQHRQTVSASDAEIVSDSVIPQDHNKGLIDLPPPSQQSFLGGRNDQELSPVASDVPNHRRRSESPPPSNSTISAKMQLVQHEEQLQREGLQLAPADSTVPWQTWPGNMFSSSHYSLDYPAGLDDDDYTTQPIDTAYYVRLYFLHFNPQWPFIHEASFRYQEEPTVLVLALVMVGLWITGEAKARRQAWKIHDRLHTLIKEQMVSFEFDCTAYILALDNSEVAQRLRTFKTDKLAHPAVRAARYLPMAHGNIPIDPPLHHLRSDRRPTPQRGRQHRSASRPRTIDSNLSNRNLSCSGPILLSIHARPRLSG